MSSDTQVQSPTSSTTSRPARSKNGCNACRLSPLARYSQVDQTNSSFRRRKVRCNERKPRCSHCERLNLDCTWNRTTVRRGAKETSTPSQIGQSDPASSIQAPFESFGASNFSEVFNSTWDEAMLLSPTAWPDYSMTTPAAPGLLSYSMGETYAPPPLPGLPKSIRSPDNAMTRVMNSTTSPLTYISSEGSPGSMDNEYLLSSFLQIFIPPILAPVEVGPKLSTTRSFFASLSSESPMVRHAIMAFSAFQLSGTPNGTHIDYNPFYEKASQELRTALAAAGEARGVRKKELKHILAAIFLLTYTDVSRPATFYY